MELKKNGDDLSPFVGPLFRTLDGFKTRTKSWSLFAGNDFQSNLSPDGEPTASNRKFFEQMFNIKHINSSTNGSILPLRTTIDFDQGNVKMNIVKIHMFFLA